MELWQLLVAEWGSWKKVILQNKICGKFNLYLAVSCFQEIVAKSCNNVNDDGQTAIDEYYIPFLFDQDETNAEFQIIEILGDFEYKYGFEYNDKKVVSEWMYRKNLSTNRNTVIFEREESALELGAAVLNNRTMFVDELNIKLHPLLLKLIIDLFYNENSTAQLVYTTHDTTLLDKKFFRRGQILFVQKDECGHSELMSLSDFKVRSDASFEKDYLAGVYGGIPRIKDFII